MSRSKLTPEAKRAILRWRASGQGQPEILRRLASDFGLTVVESTITRFLQGVRRTRAVKRTTPADVAQLPGASPAPVLTDLEEDLEILRRLRARWAEIALDAEPDHLTLVEQQKASAELRAVIAELHKALGIEEPRPAIQDGGTGGEAVAARLEEMAAALAEGKAVA